MTFSEKVSAVAERLIEDDTVAVFEDSNAGQAAARAAADLLLGWASYDTPYQHTHEHEYQPHDLDEVIAQLVAWKHRGFPKPSNGLIGEEPEERSE